MLADAKKCAEFIRSWDNIALICHRDPDGDTYGSATALADALISMGKRVRIECIDRFPKNLDFLGRDYPDFIEDYTIAVDIAAPNMMGDRGKRRDRIDMCIDHHPTNPGYAALCFLTDYAAAGEAVYEIIRELGVKPSPFAATALFTALSSDTGGFRFANTTPQTLRYAADLMDSGADVELVRVRLFESNSRGRVKVESDAMSNARFYGNGEIAVISVSLDTVRENKIEESELEGLASQPLTIDGVHMAITLKEREDGSVRVSMRSDSDDFDVSAICARFKGGGHVRAAGCRIWDTLEAAEEMLVSACREVLG